MSQKISETEPHASKTENENFQDELEALIEYTETIKDKSKKNNFINKISNNKEFQKQAVETINLVCFYFSQLTIYFTSLQEEEKKEMKQYIKETEHDIVKKANYTFQELKEMILFYIDNYQEVDFYQYIDKKKQEKVCQLLDKLKQKIIT